MINPSHLNISKSNKTVVAVCVYNRMDNIRIWINAWEQCDQSNAELIIIHNNYGDDQQKERFESYCQSKKIKCISVNRPGFDIGRFQDVCLNRLPGFPEWDKLLWCTDDVLPMAKDFVQQYEAALIGKGLVCMEVSPHVVNHIRTTGFMIDKATAGKIKFPADPITTKQQCYLFEHRGGASTLTQQLMKFGIKYGVVGNAKTAPLWDSGYHRRLPRQGEHNALFGSVMPSEKILFICPVFNMYPQIISSLICQTYRNWELLLIHNGPVSADFAKLFTADDPRIKFIVYPENTGCWGHKLREWALREIANDRLCNDAAYIVITNADNYHIPTYCEYMIKGFLDNPLAKAVYCSEMVHNYKAWQVIPCRPALGYIDCAGVMVKKSVACEVGWSDTESHSSDWTYFADIISRYHVTSFHQVRGCLLVHN